MRVLLSVGALLGLTGVAAGAFGAHVLRDTLSPRLLEAFATGARYQLLHAAVIVAIALALRAGAKGSLLVWTARVLALGTVIFSGSLYALALSGVRAFGAITPIGGLVLLSGWALLFAAALRYR